MQAMGNIKAILSNDTVHDAFMPSVMNTALGNELKRERMEPKNFLHEHPLHFFEEWSNVHSETSSVNCSSGCGQPISTQFYACIDWTLMDLFTTVLLVNLTLTSNVPCSQNSSMESFQKLIITFMLNTHSSSSKILAMKLN
ncbi:hypothetical protein SLEP1_g41960 [Rubroshorea leprosula]|uniref:Uncharacterized protein n=1 Tax=Rubroshorea leprosula TaxID=152421 RepID=A0AAV5L8T5_9ROSI|nr:hypothetical protein SLEP1_g41960 [Rubroshorea leprosula]